MFKYKDCEIVGSTKTENGICPNCGSDKICYYGIEMDTDFDGIVASQNCMCENCGFDYEEWYRLVYDGFTVEMGKDNLSFNAQGELA